MNITSIAKEEREKLEKQGLKEEIDKLSMKFTKITDEILPLQKKEELLKKAKIDFIDYFEQFMKKHDFSVDKNKGGALAKIGDSQVLCNFDDFDFVINNNLKDGYECIQGNIYISNNFDDKPFFNPDHSYTIEQLKEKIQSYNEKICSLEKFIEEDKFKAVVMIDVYSGGVVTDRYNSISKFFDKQMQ